jgi:DNA-directed RNA polymerase subunit K/omega
MTFGSPDVGKFEFVRVASLRAAQLMRGCAPRVPASGKPTTTAQREVVDGTVRAMPRVPLGSPEGETAID